jgi:hypothetical protein
MKMNQLNHKNYKKAKRFKVEANKNINKMKLKIIKKYN